MKKRTIAAIFLLALALIGATSAVAQEGGGMVRVITAHVKLGHQQHYETLIPKVWDALRKTGEKGTAFVSAGLSEPGTYVYVVPIATLADVMAQEERLGQAFAANPALAEFLEITESIDQEVWVDRPDLAYAPATPRLKMEERAFTRIALLYPHPGQALALEGVLKEAAALRKKHNLSDGSGVGQLLLGADGPAYAVLIDAKDEADFHVQAAKDNQKMGAEWQAILAKGGPMVRRVEYSSSAARPALNLQP